MIILSIFMGTHASVAIVENNEIRIQMDLSQCRPGATLQDLVDSCLGETGLDLIKIDLICTGCWRETPHDAGFLTGFMPRLNDQEVVPFSLRVHKRRLPVLAIAPHLGHAAHAFFTSEFSESGILTYCGDQTGHHLFLARGMGNRIIFMSQHDVPDIIQAWRFFAQDVFNLNTETPFASIAALAEKASSPKKHGSKLKNLIRRGKLGDFKHPDDLSKENPSRHQVALELVNASKDLLCSAFEQILAGYSFSEMCFSGNVMGLEPVITAALQRSGFNKPHLTPALEGREITLGMALYGYHHFGGHPR